MKRLNAKFRLPSDCIEVKDDELVLILGGMADSGGKGKGCGCRCDGGSVCGCGCDSGNGCGCDCGGGKGCGCGCDEPETVEAM